MTAAELVTEVRRRGAHIAVVAGSKLSVRWPDESTAAELKPLLLERKPEVLDALEAEVAWREHLMRAQVVAAGQGPLPVLCAYPPDEVPRSPGSCWSCGVPGPVAGIAARCGPCRAAVDRVLAAVERERR